MCRGELAMMASGPWAWLELRKCGIDFDLAPLPGVGGKPGRPFVGVLSALINRASPNGDLAVQFLEEYVCTEDGLRAIDADVAIGVPALKALAEELSAKNPLIKMTYENALNGVVMPNIPQLASSGVPWGQRSRLLRAGRLLLKPRWMRPKSSSKNKGERKVADPARSGGAVRHSSALPQLYYLSRRSGLGGSRDVDSDLRWRVHFS